ncbi:chorismate-binding protein [Patescibacteria group bacterium]|nr:chorismate-binding protein [Patescibacteria group bacterium]MBU2259807.1 chorismate-binding protein [Patescibacteria group bacterium]
MNHTPQAPSCFPEGPEPDPDPVKLIKQCVTDNAPFAIVQKEDEDAHVFSGPVDDYERLEDIPRKKFLSSPYSGVRYETLEMIPYEQIRERGLEARQSGAKIRCMQIRQQTRIATQDLLCALPDAPITLEERMKCSQTEEEYAETVRRMIKEQIGEGNVCNVVICLKAQGKIANMSPHTALSIFRRLLRYEFSAYMTYFFFDGKQYFIGASPERHLTVDHGTVTMNPISGTYRKVLSTIDPEEFEKFLRNPKEINELFMCLDEELKQMAQMCEEGGTIEGPFLREMSKLVHTEYLLIGHSQKDCMDLLRASMHAPTVTGSPQQSACRAIAETEREPRGYYAGELFLHGHCHDCGEEVLDSAIAIRSMTILPNGCVIVRAGASLVRDSVPNQEYKECMAKASGALQGIIEPPDEVPQPQLPLIMNERLQRILTGRNRNINRFLVEDQEGRDLTVPELSGKTITIVNYEDDFSYTLKHMMAAMSAHARVVSFEEFDLSKDTSDLIVVGPGPESPLDEGNGKMQHLEKLTAGLRASGRPFLSVCLGHQKLCQQLGFTVKKKEFPTQGTQQTIDFFGREERVGFYNTFVAINDAVCEDVEVCSDSSTGEIHALRGAHFSSFQFHPESIFSRNGFRILAEELKRLVRKKDKI